MDTVYLYGIKYSYIWRPKAEILHGQKRRVICGTAVKKLAIEIPADLLERATTASGKGVTPTVRRGLELVAVGGAYGRLRKFRGKAKFHVKLSELRQD